MEGDDYEDDEPKTLRETHWWVQPRWVKVLTFVIAVPSFAYLWLRGGADPFGTPLGTASVIGFVLVAFLQLLFVFRAYWRMDI